jgi:hypothetical protein
MSQKRTGLKVVIIVAVLALIFSALAPMFAAFQ